MSILLDMEAMEYPEKMQRLREERVSRANDMRRDGATYREIGAALGITRQRAHQLVNGAPRTKETSGK